MAVVTVKVMSMFFRRAFVPALATASALLLLAGCAAPTEPAGSVDKGAAPAQKQTQEQKQEPESRPSLQSEGTVIVRLPDRSFTFIATLCSKSEEDLLVSGPGVDIETQEIAYFDLDFVAMDDVTSGSARIDIGTDKPMTSSEEFYVANVGTAEEYSIMRGENSTTVEGTFRAGNGEPIGPGTIVIDCN